MSILERSTVGRPSWDEHFLDMAELVARRSKDPSTQVGAVLVDPQRRVVATGYNGLPRGVKDTPERLHTREIKYKITLHAEQNAILFAGRGAIDCTLYVSHPACSHCAATIIQAGVARVVYPKPSADFLSRWQDSHDLALALFQEARVRVDEMRTVKVVFEKNTFHDSGEGVIVR